MAARVHSGDVNNLKNIADRSQNKIIMDNPFGYYPLNDEVLRVLSDEGTIIIRGVDGKINKYMKNLEAIAETAGLNLTNKQRILSKGYLHTNGTTPIKCEFIDKYEFKRKSE